MSTCYACWSKKVEKTTCLKKNFKNWTNILLCLGLSFSCLKAEKRTRAGLLAQWCGRFGVGHSLLWGLPCAFQRVEQHPGLYLLDAGSSPLPPVLITQNISRHWQRSCGGKRACVLRTAVPEEGHVSLFFFHTLCSDLWVQLQPKDELFHHYGLPAQWDVPYLHCSTLHLNYLRLSRFSLL